MRLWVIISIIAWFLSMGQLTHADVTLEDPTGRAVYQRNNQNVATIQIEGTFTGTADRIEARAVVMPGENSGMTRRVQIK